jgi:carbamoyltransferase
MAIRTDQKTRVLGISAYYHDSAAALVIDGNIVAAAHEERFTRKKHDDRFPESAIRYALEEYSLTLEDIDAIVFYDKPFLKFERILQIFHENAPHGLKSFVTAMPVWVKEKLFAKRNIWKKLEEIHGGKFTKKPKLLFSEHHLSHAASAFYPSPFERAAILTIDGVGEWATTTIGEGDGGTISIHREMHFPDSLGLLYSAFTYYCGFKINSGEYKLMGLAPYADRQDAEVIRYKKLIEEHIVNCHDDGSITLAMEYFLFTKELRTVNDARFEQLFGFGPRTPESALDSRYIALAQAIQEVTNECVIRLAKTAQKITKLDSVVLAGGVALNCVSNARLVEAGIFKRVWIQPAAGDAGGALGAALVGYYLLTGSSRPVVTPDAMNGSLLGPEYDRVDTEKMIRKYGAKAKYIDFDTDLYDRVADLLSQGNVVGWMQGRMEWGPRALGNRSILGDPRSPLMQKKLNLSIKYREGFRPFAPSVLREDAGEYFTHTGDMPYMLVTTEVVESRRKPRAPQSLPFMERLYVSRSDIPSVTHLDYSARVQTVDKTINPRYWNLISAFKSKTGYGLVINTSFNVRNEPIVCTPSDAYRCFMATEMDYLVIGNYLFNKREQPLYPREIFELQCNDAD